MKCPTCKREGDLQETKHHLQTRRKDKKDKVPVCEECHKQIHMLFTDAELRDPRLGLDTIEGLLANERFAKAVKFIRTIPPGTFMRAKESRHKKRKRGRR